MVDVCQGDATAGDLVQDLLGGSGPDEGGAYGIVSGQVYLYLGDQVRAYLEEHPEEPWEQAVAAIADDGGEQ